MVANMVLTMRFYAQPQLLLHLSLTFVLVMSWNYTYSTDLMTWTTAQTWCQSQSRILMVIQSENDHTYLKDNLPKQKHYYWIGLRKTDGNWIWQVTETLLRGNGFWAPNEPNNGKLEEDCVEMYINNEKTNGQWNDEPCNNQKHALCYEASCSESSCSKNAECVEKIKNYTCKCNPGFTGPSCEEAVRCDPVGIPENGNMTCSAPLGKSSFRSLCAVTCKEGYVLRGEKTLTCMETGNWSAETALCEAVRCDPVVIPENGNMTCSAPLGKFSFRSSCAVTCKEGYVLRGEKTLTCMETGDWSAETPVCEAILCKTLFVPDGGTVSCYTVNSTAQYSVCTVQCSPAYFLLGAHEYTCRPDGSWNYFQPLCASYKLMLVVLSGLAAFSTVCCFIFCYFCCRNRKKSVKKSDQEEVLNPVYDASDGPLQDPLSLM